MKVAVIGTGYVGLVSGACFSEFGHHVICVDKDADKVARLKAGEIPIFEPGLEDLVARNVEAGRLTFTTDTAEGMADAAAVFIAVGTPSRRGDGHADLTYVHAAAGEIGEQIRDYTVIVTKSTVPVGTTSEIERRLRERYPDTAFDVVSNPEFLREGAAIEDFMRPNRVVVGTTSERAKDVVRELYRPLFLNDTPVLFTNPETSELIKYASNA
ncbi:MAG: nucleotide sugar dehydrogenase, partial [Sphingomonadales bacterium]